MSDNESKIVEGSDLKDAIEVVSKPCLDILEATVLKALGIIDNKFKDSYSDIAKKHAEASIYEEIAVTCIKRIMALSTEIVERNDPERAALIKLSLNLEMRKVGIDTSQMS